MKLSNQFKAIFIIILILLIVPFFESKRVEVFAIQIENPILRSLILTYVSKTDGIKSFFGLRQFLNGEENSRQYIRERPNNLIHLPVPEITTALTITAVTEPTATPVITIVPTITIDPFSTINPPYNILVVGDSFIAESFGPALEKELLNFKDTKVFRKGISSTGLSRPDYFDWEKEIDKLVLDKKPNIAFVMFGANDGQSQTSLDKKIIRYGASGWNEEYTNRVTRFLQILEDNHVFVFWIGNSIARDKYYTDEMANLNSVYQSVCQKFPNCLYLETWSALSTPDGKYLAYLPDESGQKRLARAPDGVHTSAFGSQIMLKNIMEKIMGKIKFQKIE